MGKSTVSAATLKPYATFPLTPHAGAGQWCKKHRGKLYYFGVLADWQAALAEYDRTWPYIITGRAPPAADGDGVSVAGLCDAFLNAKLDALHAGEITPRTFAEYHKTTDRIVSAFGKTRAVEGLTPEDFGALRAKLSETRGPTSLANEIQRCRVAFKYAADNRLVDRPLHFGSSFDKPSAKSIRRARAAKVPQFFTADELRRIIKAADPTLRAMILIGVNCAYGAADVASLPQTALNLADGWLDFARVKTAVPRRAALWDETVQALRVVLKSRPTPRNPADADLVFITRNGKRWVQESKSDNPKRWGSRLDLISRAFARLLDAEGVSSGRGFYCLRRTFQTIAEEQSGDFPAVSHVMGHAPKSGDMSATYRQRISDTRLQDVAETVRGWLWPAAS